MNNEIVITIAWGKPDSDSFLRPALIPLVLRQCPSYLISDVM